MESLIQAIGSAISLSLILFFLRKFVPYKPPWDTHTYSLDLLRPEYARWDRITLALIFVITPLLGYLFFHILKTLATLIVGRFEDSPYVLLPFRIFWALPAGFLGLITAVIPVELILRNFLEEKYEEYEIYQNLQYRFDGKKVMKILSNIVVVVFAVYLTFVFDFYVVFSNTEIIINEFLSFSEERYRYADIRAIEVERFPAYKNPARTETHYVIAFDNGKLWYSRLGPDELNDAHFRKIMEFVAKRSGVAISNPPLRHFRASRGENK